MCDGVSDGKRNLQKIDEGNLVKVEASIRKRLHICAGEMAIVWKAYFLTD